MSWSGTSLCHLTATSFPCCESLLLSGLPAAYLQAACCSADLQAIACSHLIPKDLLISKGKDSVLLPPQYRQFYTKVRPDPGVALVSSCQTHWHEVRLSCKIACCCCLIDPALPLPTAGGES